MKRLTRIMVKMGGLVLLLMAVSASVPNPNAEAWVPPSPCFDFVTGGGWFTPTPLGSAQANFGFEAGYKNGPPPPPLMGNLNYIDHNTGMHVKVTSVDTYEAFACSSPCQGDRAFTGKAEIDGVPGFTYRVEVIDAGEPGNAPKGQDRFIITLSNGYHADSGGFGFQNPPDQTGIDGGNIQIHKPCSPS